MKITNISLWIGVILILLILTLIGFFISGVTMYGLIWLTDVLHPKLDYFLRLSLLCSFGSYLVSLVIVKVTRTLSILFSCILFIILLTESIYWTWVLWGAWGLGLGFALSGIGFIPIAIVLFIIHGLFTHLFWFIFSIIWIVGLIILESFYGSAILRKTILSI